MQDDDAGDPPFTLLIVALVIGVIAVLAFLVISATRRTPPPPPVAIAAVPAPQADSPECRALIATLPERLGDFERAVEADPVPAGTAAWRGTGEPVIMRCGLGRPAEFVVGSPIQMVDDVGWFRLADAELKRSTWISVDRPVYVALTLPDGSGPGPIQSLSEVIARTMPVMPIRPAPAG